MRRRAGPIVLSLLLLTLVAAAPGGRALTYPVTGENVITGATTGIAPLQAPDGVAETLREADAADPLALPGAQWIAPGSQTAGSFPGGLGASDDAWVTYREGATGATTTVEGHPSGWGACGFANPDRGRLQDDAYATSSANNVQCVYTGFGFALAPGSAVAKVELGHDSFSSGDDDWTLALSWDGGASWCAGVRVNLPTSDGDTLAYTDFTSCRPWTPGEVNAVAARFTHTAQGGTNTNSLDETTVRVTYIPPGNYQLGLQYNWTGVPSGQGQVLIVEGHVSDEAVEVQVLTPPATWTTRFSLAATGDRTSTYALTAAEFSGGSPSVRFVDAGGADGTPSDLFLDRVGIVTADPDSFPGAQWVAVGSQPAGAFPGGIQASDDAWVTYREGATGATTTVTRHPTAWGPCAFANADQGRMQDDAYATSSANNVQCVYTGFGFSIPTGSLVTRVEMGFDAFTSNDDRYTITLSWDGGTSWCSGITVGLPTSDTDTLAYTDFTACRPWGPADVNAVAARFTHTAQGGTNTNSLDETTVRVTYIPPGNYQLSLRYNWTGVPWGVGQMLVVEGHVSDEAMALQVLTPPGSWNPRLTLSGTTDQTLYYNLTAAEFSGGSPSVRFVDGGADGTQSDLLLDQVKIVSTLVNYRMEVVQEIGGVGGSSPLLLLKGNITPGGENFDVYLRNWSSGGWDLRLSAPFTAANAWHNVSIVGPEVGGGGLVAVRFVDAQEAGDTVADALSLDIVAVTAQWAPSLGNGGASPAAGNTTTTFSFYVRYVDPDNDAPLYVRLRINGQVYDMVANDSADQNYADGKAYHYDLVLGVRGSFPYNFTARAAAGDGTIATTPNGTIVVLNRPPAIANPPGSDGVHAGRPYRRGFNATDPDGDPLTWSLTTNASWLAIGPTNGTVWGYRPLGNFTYFVNVTVVDTFGLAASANYSLVVGNLAPAITAPPANGTAFRTGFVRRPTAVDGDGDPLLWSLATNGSRLRIDPATGEIGTVGTPPPGLVYLLVTVDDGFGGRASVNFTVDFLNRPPTIAGSPTLVARAGTDYAVAFAATDLDGDPLAWSLGGNATWLTLDASGRLAGRALPGRYLVNVTVRDPYGGEASRAFILVVVAPGGGGFEDLLPWLLPALAVVAAVLLLFLILRRRRERGDVILRAYLFTDKAVVLQELVSDEEEPPVKFKEIFKFLIGGRAAGEHWLDLPPYKVAVVEEGKLHLAAVTRLDDEARVKAEASKLLQSLLGDEEVKAALPRGGSPGRP